MGTLISLWIIPQPVYRAKTLIICYTIAYMKNKKEKIIKKFLDRKEILRTEVPLSQNICESRL